MGINSIMVDWIASLVEGGVFTSKASILDIGRQSFATSPHIPFLAIERIAGTDAAGNHTRHSFDREKSAYSDDAVSEFWRHMGFSDYKSLDAFDNLADHKINLNFPLPKFDGKFCVIANFGTVEHVFNIKEALESIHSLTACGGIILLAMPSFGEVNHGFYNFNPTFIFDVAHSNSYDIVDFHYVDDISNRSLDRDFSEAYRTPFDFGSLPVRLPMDSDHELNELISDTFCENHRRRGEARTPRHVWPVLDMCLVAMRKSTEDTAFQQPVQRVYRREEPC